MIYGIGIDIVEISRIKSLLDKHSNENSLKKILTTSEFNTFVAMNDNKKINYVSKCFAVKEACSKAYGTGFSQGITLNDFSYQKNKDGKPYINTYGLANKILLEQNLKIYLSVSDEKNYTVANVVIEI